MTQTPAPATCAYSDRQASCPGPEETLPHSENGLTRRNLAFHIAKCPTCLATTLRCLRAGCPVAGRPFVGEAGLPGVTGWDGLLETWSRDVSQQLGWPAQLSPTDADNFREEAIAHAWKVLLQDSKLDPESVLEDGRPLGPYIKEAMRNRMRTLRRMPDVSDRDPSTGKFKIRTRVRVTVLNPAADDDSQDRSDSYFPHAHSAEEEALADREREAVEEVFRQHYGDLADQPDRQFIFGEWFKRRCRREQGGELTQTQLAELLQQDRKRRNDGSAHEARPSQTTISRWINQSRLAIATMLGDPKRGIDPSSRNAALELIAPNKHAHKTDPPEATK